MARSQFRTECQKDVYEKVRRYLDDLVDEHWDDAEHCDFYLKYGSTLIEISIDPYEEADDAFIEVLAYCVHGVEPAPELMAELLRVNTVTHIGAFGMIDRDVFYSHTFLGRSLEPDQLVASLHSVATVADEYDDRIVARWGGETALDRLRGRSPRAGRR